MFVFAHSLVHCMQLATGEALFSLLKATVSIHKFPQIKSNLMCRASHRSSIMTTDKESTASIWQLTRSQLPPSDNWQGVNCQLTADKWQEVKLPTSWTASHWTSWQAKPHHFFPFYGGLPHWNEVASSLKWGFDLHSHSHNPMMFGINTICPSWTKTCADTCGNTQGRHSHPSLSPGTSKSLWLLHPAPWHSAQ